MPAVVRHTAAVNSLQSVRGVHYRPTSTIYRTSDTTYKLAKRLVANVKTNTDT